MKRSILALTAIFFASSLSAQTISINFYQPSDNTIVTANSVTVKVSASSTYALKSIIATAGANRDSLVYNPGSQFFEGSLSLTGLTDTVVIKVVVTDVLNHKDSALKKIIYDPLPVLTIAKPLDFSVANPTIEVKASCQHANGCRINVNGSATAYQDSADVMLDLSQNEGSEYYITVTATENKRNQSVTQYIHVYVESSPYLTLLYTADDKIWDFNFNHLLTAKTQIPFPASSATSVMTAIKLIDLADSSVTNIPYNGNIAFRAAAGDWTSENVSVQAYVTPYGAIFSGIPTDPALYPFNNDSIYEWHQPALSAVSSGLLNSSVSLNVSADRKYAIWSEGLSNPIIRYRNLATGANTDINISSGLDYLGNYDNDISSNGTVAFWGGRANPAGTSTYYNDVLKYQGGVSTFISDSSQNKWAMRPVTDGTSIIYEKIVHASPDNFQIIFHNSSIDTILSDLGTVDPGTRQYQVNSGYAAFVKKGISGQLEIWLRDSTGMSTRLSYFNNSSVLERLASNGDVTYYCNNTNSFFPGSSRRYISDRSGSITEIGAAFGKVFNINNQWYVAIGRNLYGVNFHPVPNSISSFFRDDHDTAYRFTASDFVANFEGGGSLMGIKITGLPTQGQLLLNNAPVALNTVLSRSDINNLSYRVNGGFTGIDSIRWNATNGMNFTSANAYVTLGRLLPPVRPGIIDLDSSYCSNSGVQKARITNLPDTTKGYTVSVRLDQQKEALDPDSSFSINTGTLQPGTHTVVVVYSNMAGMDSTTAFFVILPVTTPVVSLSASETTVNPNISLVNLTAKNVAGGGAAPQFTFSSDRGGLSILQKPGAGNELTLPVSSLNTGNNWVYVQMSSGNRCTISGKVTDSIKIIKTGNATLMDPDYPDHVISIYPNPFKYQVSIGGLQPAKTYLIALYTMDGRQVLSQVVTGVQVWQAPAAGLKTGLYTLKLSDMTQNKVIGATTLLAQ